MKKKKININLALCNLDEKYIEKVSEINTNKKYKELIKMNKKKGKVDIAKTIKSLLPI